ncbi:MAG: PGPGW domain-containing protein [Gammaproteobacteria bacterium]
MFDWLSVDGQTMGLLALFSVITFFGTLFLIPFLVARIPADYFASGQHQAPWRHRHPVLRGLLFVTRNAMGLLLLLAGVIMLVTPGQGVITVLIGLILMDFPGKYGLERKLVTQPAVLRSINWLRAKVDQPPLVLGEE